MEINSLNAHLTSADHEKALRWDQHRSEVEIISAASSLVILAHRQFAAKIAEALRPLLGDITLAPVTVEEPPRTKTVQVTSGLRSAGGS